MDTKIATTQVIFLCIYFLVSLFWVFVASYVASKGFYLAKYEHEKEIMHGR